MSRLHCNTAVAATGCSSVEDLVTALSQTKNGAEVPKDGEYSWENHAELQKCKRDGASQCKNSGERHQFSLWRKMQGMPHQKSA